VANQYDKYRFRQTPLTDEQFNRRFRDIDKRIDVVEQLGFEFSEKEELIIAEALRRINEEIRPVIEQIQGFVYLGNLLYCESPTPVEIGTGVKLFVVDPAFRQTFAVPLFLIASSRSDASRWMAGQALSWNRETGELVIGVTNTRGLGSASDWRISVASIPPDIPPAQQADNVGVAAINGLLANDVQGALAEHQGDIDALLASLVAKAGLESPDFTGNPTVPTQTAGNNTTRIATTAFVQAAVAALVGSAPAALDTLAELASALNADANFAATVTSQLAARASLASPAFTGTPTAPTPPGGTDTAQIATAAFVQAALAAKANLASPVFSGTPAAPTAGAGTNTTQIATTAFVQSAIASRIASVIVTPAKPNPSNNGQVVLGGIVPSISGTTLTLTATWREVDQPAGTGESSTGG
jgi:hypothetical protein